MKDLMKTEDREIKKTNLDEVSSRKNKIRELRARIADEAYLNHAINKLATDLSHYLTK